MTYDEIRDIAYKPKESHNTCQMVVKDFGQFSVMQSDKTGAILVDSDVANIASKRRWCIDTGGYPVANFGGSVIRLHDFVLAINGFDKPNGNYVDHINFDKMDNRLNNLRFVVPKDSAMNMPLKNNNTSGVTGVSETKNGTYRAYITYDKKRMDLGYYKTINEAAAARREAESRLGFKTRPKTIKEHIERARK